MTNPSVKIPDKGDTNIDPFLDWAEEHKLRFLSGRDESIDFVNAKGEWENAPAGATIEKIGPKKFIVR